MEHETVTMEFPSRLRGTVSTGACGTHMPRTQAERSCLSEAMYRGMEGDEWSPERTERDGLDAL